MLQTKHTRMFSNAVWMIPILIQGASELKEPILTDTCTRLRVLVATQPSTDDHIETTLSFAETE